MSISSGGGGGGVTNATRKNLASTGANETVFCAAVLWGMFATFRNVRPSSLASRSGPAGGGPNGHLNPAIASDAPRIATGFGNANWIQALSPTGAFGSDTDRAKSPSASHDG